MSKRLRNLVPWLGLSITLVAASGCKPGYIKASDLESRDQGPSSCANSCRDLGMRMVAMVLVSNSLPGCVCQVMDTQATQPAPPAAAPATPPTPPPGATLPPPTSGLSDTASEGAAASTAGYIVIAAAAAARQQQLREQQEQQQHQPHPQFYNK